MSVETDNPCRLVRCASYADAEMVVDLLSEEFGPMDTFCVCSMPDDRPYASVIVPDRDGVNTGRLPPIELMSKYAKGVRDCLNAMREGVTE